MLVVVCMGLGSLAVVGGTHEEGCVPTFADPATVNQIDLTSVGGSLYYDEERGNPLGTDPPIPFSAFLHPKGQGTWIYEESNGLVGMQRGGLGIPDCFPDPPLPCLVIADDPANDVHCGHGGDHNMF